MFRLVFRFGVIRTKRRVWILQNPLHAWKIYSYIYTSANKPYKSVKEPHKSVKVFAIRETTAVQTSPSDPQISLANLQQSPANLHKSAEEPYTSAKEPPSVYNRVIYH